MKENSMRKFIPILMIAVLIGAGIFYGLYQTTNTPVKDIDVKMAQGFLAQENNEVIVLGVRTSAEYNTEHIKGAININVSNDKFSEQVTLLDRKKIYLVHCATNIENGRSEKAITTMNNLGFKNLVSMTVGIMAWGENGYPLIKGHFE